jgi:hypothetical protein
MSIPLTIREMAKLGGQTAAANMTPEARQARARKAGKASARSRKRKRQQEKTK